MSDAAIGYGITYEIWDAGASPAAFVPMEEVFAVTPGAEAGDRVEVTHMLSPGRRREYIAGLIDPGEASFEMNYIPGSDSDLLIRSLIASGAVVEHRITFPNNQRVTFDAAITGYEKDLPVDDRMTATVTIAVSGEETWDVAA